MPTVDITIKDIGGLIAIGVMVELNIMLLTTLATGKVTMLRPPLTDMALLTQRQLGQIPMGTPVAPRILAMHPCT